MPAKKDGIQRDARQIASLGWLGKGGIVSNVTMAGKPSISIMTSATADGSTSASNQETAGILVVDDNASNLLAIKVALEGLDANIVQAQSGPEALRHLLARD